MKSGYIYARDWCKTRDEQSCNTQNITFAVLEIIMCRQLSVHHHMQVITWLYPSEQSADSSLKNIHLCYLSTSNSTLVYVDLIATHQLLWFISIWFKCFLFHVVWRPDHLEVGSVVLQSPLHPTFLLQKGLAVHLTRSVMSWDVSVSKFVPWGCAGSCPCRYPTV